MKHCQSCQEDFSDKFSFCPVCGGALNAAKPQSVASVQNINDESIASSSSSIKPTVAASDFYSNQAGNVEKSVTESFVSDKEPIVNGHNGISNTFNSQIVEESVVTESFDADDEQTFSNGASSNLARNVNDEEFHFTFMDDKGVGRRLFEEILGIARQSQLTWPEFKKNPIGFIRRTFAAYGQAFLGFLSNRSVMAALGASVLIMGALVAVALLLDRSQSATTSRLGIGLFAAVAGILLIGVFASWMTSGNQALQQGTVSGSGQRVTTSSSPWYLVAGILTVLGVPLLFLGIFALILWLGLMKPATVVTENPNENLELVQEVEIPKEEEKKEGNAGNAKGDGGGAKPKREKPSGGGGGGRENEPKPVSQGKIAQASPQEQIIPPTPDPPRLPKPSLPTPVTNKADSTLFPPDNRDVAYGDPRSKSTDPSAGQGKGNGMGGGEGSGQGSGQGAGVGPGRGENTGGGDGNYGGGGPGGGGGTDYNRTFQPREVTQKAVITAKPQPEYTEEARKNQIQGVVRVSMVLSSSGSVQNVRAVTSLPYGLTEKAIAAARRIQFTTAKKDGRAVSQYVTVEYNFRIY